MAKTFWEMLDVVLEHGSKTAGERVEHTAEELASRIMAHADYAGGVTLGAYDVARELRGAFAQYSNWAITNVGEDRFAFIKR